MLAKAELEAFVAALLARRRVVAPVLRNGDVVFGEVTSAADAVLHYRNTRLSAKAALFPQVECLVRFARELDRYNEAVVTPLDDTPTVLLAARPATRAACSCSTASLPRASTTIRTIRRGAAAPWW